MVNAGNTRIGWIGTGVMGLSMCSRIIDAGYDVTVYNRTKEKAEPLLQKGAHWADSPSEVAVKSDVVVTIVGFPEDVRQVYLDEKGLIEGSRPGTILIDMTTTEPALACTIYERAKSKGVHFLDAPVSGGDVGAREGTLSIMVGGDREIFETVHPLLTILGKNIVYQGKAGSGQHTKMCNQIVIAGTMIGICEALLYGYKAGLDLTEVLKSIARGAAACWSLDNLAPRILTRNFDPGFFVEHFIKDLGIALKEAERMNLALPGLSLARQLYVAARAQGHGHKGTHALILALEHLSGLKIFS
ncbi:3-hydroxyisobutyrate dehydrogenase [Thermodesulforhabdus norvegica]|uniref:3-hydroxyisobutyrate dehydrogenase n=2 Tax=Thermodesulforhabdus norvegica TaxID=39841 RepID=A0A1I4T649_9BACT|nr:NAD(P)-dependent oxidoreductase [Thermodesulforhabdus norvegica]SFM72248.1 3-hydroxyisobutyrate dehydrogenase [Thermodesulforhabdus norvegica]